MGTFIVYRFGRNVRKFVLRRNMNLKFTILLVLILVFENALAGPKQKDKTGI